MRLLQLCLALVIYGCPLCKANSDAHNRLAIIIDDIGYNKTLSERAAHLPGAFTLSILPLTPSGFSTAQLAHNNGKEIMLHAPMSNLKNLPLGAGGLYSDMDKEVFITVLRKDLNSVPFIKGMNNHMGSRLTQEATPMNWTMEELQHRGLYFVDSRTSALTVALEAAQAHNIPSLKRDVFLDDEQNINAITQQLYSAFAIAKHQGTAIAIGHPYLSTLSVLEKIQPLLEQQNISLVFVSQLMSKTIIPIEAMPIVRPTQTLDYCAAPPLSLWFQPIISIKLVDVVAATLLDILEIE